MENNWRVTAKSISKYDPQFRDQNGNYKKEDWIGFFQIGQTFNGVELKLNTYLETEERYIKAAINFFEHHNCTKIVLRSLEKNDFSDYEFEDRQDLISYYNKIIEGAVVSLDELGIVIKLILRELIWAELFCYNSDEVALRFGYDFYMYVNSNTNMDELFENIKQLGLYVD